MIFSISYRWSHAPGHCQHDTLEVAARSPDSALYKFRKQWMAALNSSGLRYQDTREAYYERAVRVMSVRAKARSKRG